MFLRTLFEERAHPSKDTEWYRLLYGLDSPFVSSAGVSVTEEKSMGVTAIWSAVTQLSSIIASLPLNLYRRMQRGKKKADSHTLYQILHLKPNPEQTSMVFRESQNGQLLLWGNSYAEIERNQAGQVIALWPLLSKYMEIIRTERGILYRYQIPDGKKVAIFNKEDILHVVGFSSNGLMGYNPVSRQSESIGMSMALNEYAGRFFSNNARPSAVLQHPMALSQDAQERLRSNWEKIYGGLSKSHRIAVLEEGMQLKEFGFSAQEAQMLESRKFSISDVARIWNMPPHMLKDLDRATFSNIESQGEDFVRYCLGPTLVRIEQTYNVQLLSDKDLKKYFIEHLVEGLLRGTTSERFASYATGRQWGWLSINDIREKENMNPIEGGDIYLVPLNMVPADQVGEQPETGTEEETIEEEPTTEEE